MEKNCKLHKLERWVNKDIQSQKIFSWIKNISCTNCKGWQIDTFSQRRDRYGGKLQVALIGKVGKLIH